MSGSVHQFISSRLSLISKSEICFEGTLHSLDVHKATISMAKVKSFRTVDRPTESPVPPKDEILEFIISRGSDIKGIDVIEPPQLSSDEPALLGQGQADLLSFLQQP